MVALMATATFASSFKLPANSSYWVMMSGYHWSGYMKSLKAVKIPYVTGATTATLTTILDTKGKASINYRKNTFTITAGYTNCKVAKYFDRRKLPVKVTVDLTRVPCFNTKKPVNFLPLIQSGQKITVFFAKQNGITRDTIITLK